MKIDKMTSISSQSMRTERRINGFGVSSHTLPHTRTIPVHLETANSEDSSVFAGLVTPKNSVPLEKSNYQDYHRIYSQENPHRETPKQVGRYKLKSFGKDYRDSDVEDAGTAILSVVRSRSEASSEQSHMRNMKPVTDADSAFGAESKDFNVEQPSRSVSHNRHNRSQGDNNYVRSGQNSYLYDQDGESQVSNGSDNSLEKRKGTYNMVGEVHYFDMSGQECKPVAQEERITTMLDDYEKQMEATLESLTLDDDKRDDIIGERDYLAEMYDIVPRRVQSEDAHQTLTFEQSKQLQKVLHQARKEVEILKDNNEQFMSEIEQQEEEYSSERKLFEERTRQKIAELKIIYQEEMVNIIREKDAAIVEASRQATRYGESGRKQIAHLNSQLQKVKAQANGIIRQKVEEAIKTMNTKKENEITARLGALRKSYEAQIEKMRNGSDDQVQEAVNQAITGTTERLTADHEQEMHQNVEACRKQSEIEKQNAIFASVQSLANAEKQVSALQLEREGMVNTLKSIKEDINKHYPSEMKEFQDVSRETLGPFKLLQNQHMDNNLELLFKEVIESFGFLLENNSSKKQVSCDLVEMEGLKKKVKEQEETIAQYRDEIERISREKDDNNIEALERSLHSQAIDRNQSKDLYRRDVDSQWDGIKSMHSADDLIQGMSKKRERLVRAMAIGQMELKNSLSSDRLQVLKPTDRFEPKGLDSSIDRREYKIPSHDRVSQSDRSLPAIGPSNSTESQGVISAQRNEPYEHCDSRMRGSETSNESSAKKKSYAILRGFKTSKTLGSSHVQNDSSLHPPSESKSLTRANRIRGYFNSTRREDFDTGRDGDDSCHTLDSLTDDSLESLQTNTGTDVKIVMGGANVDLNAGIVQTQSSSSLERNKTRNPLGMFAEAKKVKHNSEDATSGACNVLNSRGETLQPLQNEQGLPKNFRKKAGQGFDYSSSGHVINGKKSTRRIHAKGMIQSQSYGSKREQENTVPAALSLQKSTSSSSDYSAPNGHMMCLQPLSLEDSNRDEGDGSYLSDNRSLWSVNENGSSLHGEDMSRLRQHTSLTDASDEESADPFVMAETESSDRIPPPNAMEMCSTSTSRDSRHYDGRAFLKQKRAVRSPTSEATTAIVSHRHKPNVTNFYRNKDTNQAKRTVTKATNFASMIRARRGGRRPGG